MLLWKNGISIILKININKYVHSLTELQSLLYIFVSNNNI